MHTFDLFPAIIWEEMLDRLDTPLEKMKLIKKIPPLELLDVFQEKGTEWQFSTVLEILLGHLYRKNQRPGTWIEDKPLHPQGELESAVLNCRLVSKCVRQVVDNFANLYWKEFCWLPPFISSVHLHSLGPVEQCLAHAVQVGQDSSPFVGGGLLHIHCGEGINADGDGSPLPPHEKITELVSLPNLGNNLRGLCITINFHEDDSQGTYNFVRRLLQSVPNVLTLSISFLPVPEAEEEAPELDEDTLPVLPRLKHLKVFEFVIYEGGDSLVGDHFDFRQYFEQLTTLEISIFHWKERYHFNGPVQLPNLENLQICDIPILGWNNCTAEITGNLNAPALKLLTLKTEDLEELKLDLYFNSFDAFILGVVSGAILESTQNQFRRRERCLSQNDHGFYCCTYTFSRPVENTPPENESD